MNKPLLILFLFIVSFAFSQNLVPNPSFEQYDYCPTGMADFDAVSKWFSPTKASPDYFNVCANSLGNGAGVPENEIGFQDAQEGNAYSGFISYFEQFNFPDYREYITVKLIDNLQFNQTYYFCFWVSPIDSLYAFNSNNIGLALSNDSMVNFATESLLNIPVIYSESQIFENRTTWHKIEGSFVATGGENYLYIGNFLPNTQTSIEVIDSTFLFNEVASYYYIDNIYLGKEPCTTVSFEMPNIFTPNNDGLNEIFTFKQAQGIFDYSVSIYNRWGNRVYFDENNFNWDGTYNNEPVTEGVYFYRIDYNENESKTGFVQVVR